MKHYTLTITLHEDLHVGTGLGSGDIDATQTRDRNGAPCLPATHIKGVLRAQAQAMTQATKSHIAHIDQLFGAAGNAKSALVLTSAWLDDTSSKDTLVWGSTRIADTGTAAQDTLRFVEYVRAGSRFVAEAQLHTTDDALADFFEHVVQRTTHLGHGRQRGHGRVRWQIDKAKQAQAWSGQTPMPARFPARLRLVLRNLEPLCLAKTGQPGNVIPTEGFIRGRTLRGAFAALAIGQQDTELAQALHSAHISWGDALPLHQDASTSVGNIQDVQNAEVCAIPLSIGTPKATAPAGILPWWVQERSSPCLGDKGEVERVTRQDNDNTQEKYKRPAADEFLYRSSAKDPWLRYKPRILQRLRTRVPDRNDPDKADQALFSNEEIAEKTSFLADVIVTNAAAAHTLAQALQRFSGAWLRMGRSSRPLEIQHGIWLKNLPQPGKPAPVGFTFMLESDCIVRDEFLHYHTRLDASLLAQLVRDAGDAGAAKPGKVETGKSFVDAHPVFGFNATTGLPRPVQIAMAAGSVIHVKGDDAPRLREALSRRWALGENVEEGFGRFRLDGLPLPKSANNRAAPAPASVNPLPSMCAQAKEWAGRLDHLKKVSASQLGEARERALAAQTPADIGQLFTRIENAAAKKGGKNWKIFTGKPQYPEFKTLVLHKAASSLHDAQQLLDYFFRWCRAHDQNNQNDQNDQSTDQGQHA